ncbi:MAG: hypothetical protein ACKVG4_16415, partial [Longimicrobiales bacterium]
VEPQTSVGFAALRENEHHRPFDIPEAASKSFFVDEAGFGAEARMRVQPDAAELFRLETRIYLFVVEIGDGFVIELNGDRRALLTYQTDVLNQQQIIGRRDGEAADLGVARIPQI